VRSIRVRWWAAIVLAASSAPVNAQPSEPGAGSGSAAPAEPPPPTTGEVTGTVESPELEAPLAGATVTVVGTKISATTDDAGHFKLTVPPGEIKVRASIAGFKPEERTFKVEVGATAELAFKLTTIPQINETIVVVGSRTPRTNVDSPVPVDVVTSDEISRSGRTETGRVLSQLEPSYISVPQTIADGSDHVDPASLRGLGPDQVLVLVNGKRRHRSALMHVNSTFGRGTVGTDLNAIGLSSIKRIEVLRDGAAAQYGSDAIAGVINIVTRDDTDVVDLTTETGITASRDGAQLKAGADYGIKIGQKGYLNISGDFLQKTATNRSGQYNGAIYSDPTMTDDQILASNGLTRDKFKMRIGEAAATASMGEYDMEIPFGEGSASTFYSFGDLSYRRGNAGGFYRFPNQTAQNVQTFYPNGFLPEIHPTLNDSSVTIGLRRKGPWTIDASLTHGESSFRFDIENSVNASLGTSSPTTFDAGTLSSSETVANLDLQHKLDQDAVKESTVVLGSELRIENYQIHAGDQASYVDGNPPGTMMPKIPGAQVFPGFQPSNEVDRTRDNVGVYAGMENEVGGGLAVDFAGRFEKYSDFGQSTIGKVALREKLSKFLSLRAGANTGFRAPSLQQLWFSNVSTLFLPDPVTGNLVAQQVLTSNNQSPVTKAFGIPKLHEEQSLSFSGGFALRPTDNFMITADGYFIRIDDRIVFTSQFNSTNPTVASILAPFPGVSQAQFFANAVDTNTTGADVVADYAVETGEGTVTLTGAANFSKTEVIAVHIPQTLIDAFPAADQAQLKTFFFGRGAQSRIEDYVPHQKGYAAVRYASKFISALFRADYYGKVRFHADNPASDEVFGGKVLFDVDLGYHATKDATFSIGADNLLNTFPDPQVKAANISSGRFIYSRNVSQFGQNGGFYYAKLQLTF
jgi:iron complex outermembrane receptor protein